MFRTILIMVKGKRLQTILSFSLFCVILTSVGASSLLYLSSNDARNETLKQVGAYLTVYNNTGANQEKTVITETMQNEILSIAHVEGINATGDIFGIPENFKNCRDYTGTDPSTQNEISDYELGTIEWQKQAVALIGCLSVSMHDNFYREYNWLQEGRYPSDGGGEALISRQLAEQNNLHLGDVLQISIPEEMKPYVAEPYLEVNITGIYDTRLKFEVLDTNFMGEAVYSLHPANGIYVPMQLLHQIWGRSETGESSVVVWVDDPRNLKKVSEEIVKKNGFENFSVIDGTSTDMKQFASALETLVRSSETVTYVIVWFGVLVIVLFSTLWGNNYKRESGIFMALGYSKKRILAQVWCELSFIIIIALFVAIPLSLLVGDLYASGLHLEWSDINLISSMDRGDWSFSIPFKTKFRWGVLGLQGGIALCMSVCSLLSPIIIISQYQPREILF